MTTYAYFDGAIYIGEYAEDDLPPSAQRQDNNAWITDLANATPAEQRAAGWHIVTNTPRPPDTATLTYSRMLRIIDDSDDGPMVLETWHPRAKTDDELAGDNATTIRSDTRAQLDQLRQGIEQIRLILDTPNATINAGPAPAIKTLARECIDTMRATIRLARLATGDTDTTTTDYGTGTATTTHEWIIIL